MHAFMYGQLTCQLLHEKLTLSHCCSSSPSLAHLMDASNLLPSLTWEYWGFTYCSVCVLNLVPLDVTATLSLGRAAACLYPGLLLPVHMMLLPHLLLWNIYIYACSQINKYYKHHQVQRLHLCPNLDGLPSRHICNFLPSLDVL